MLNLLILHPELGRKKKTSVSHVFVFMTFKNTLIYIIYVEKICMLYHIFNDFFYKVCFLIGVVLEGKGRSKLFLGHEDMIRRQLNIFVKKIIISS